MHIDSISLLQAIENPDIREIVTVLESKKTGLTCGVETVKTHPKDSLGRVGRVRVSSGFYLFQSASLLVAFFGTDSEIIEAAGAGLDWIGLAIDV